MPVTQYDSLEYDTADGSNCTVAMYDDTYGVLIYKNNTSIPNDDIGLVTFSLNASKEITIIDSILLGQSGVYNRTYQLHWVDSTHFVVAWLNGGWPQFSTYSVDVNNDNITLIDNDNQNFKTSVGLQLVPLYNNQAFAVIRIANESDDALVMNIYTIDGSYNVTYVRQNTIDSSMGGVFGGGVGVTYGTDSGFVYQFVTAYSDPGSGYMLFKHTLLNKGSLAITSTTGHQLNDTDYIYPVAGCSIGSGDRCLFFIQHWNGSGYSISILFFRQSVYPRVTHTEDDVFAANTVRVVVKSTTELVIVYDEPTDGLTIQPFNLDFDADTITAVGDPYTDNTLTGVFDSDLISDDDIIIISEKTDNDGFLETFKATNITGWAGTIDTVASPVSVDTISVENITSIEQVI